MNGPSRPVPTIAPDLESLYEQAAIHVQACSAAATETPTPNGGRFLVALSGGSTPRALFELLAASDRWRTAIDWSRWYVFWGDERLVPPDDPASNYGMAHQALLSRVPIPPDQVFRVPTEAGSPEQVAARYEATLRAALTRPGDRPSHGGVPRFDLVLLGLGSDGHTASLFPASPAFEEQRRLVVATPPGTLPPAVDRVTFTLPLLNAARAVTFLAAGTDKAEVLRQVLAGDERLPAAYVRPRQGELRWLVDAHAAARI